MKKFPLFGLLCAILVSLGALILGLNFLFPGMLQKEGTLIHLVSLTTLFSYFLLILFSKRMPLTRVLRDLLIWFGIILAALMVYSYREEASSIWHRVFGNLFPTKGKILDEKTIVFEASEDGHFFVEGVANGIRLRFMVDTGASRVVLTRRDARLLGFEEEDLIFNLPSSTAGGMVFSAPLTLKSLFVGPIHLEDVPAAVGGEGLDQSLLGMSFLERLSSYRVEGGQLILKSP